MKSILVPALAVAAALCVLALLPLPYGYYTFLRLVVTVVSVAAAWQAFTEADTGWAVTFGALALLFNPIFPVHLNRSIWTFLDLGTAGVLIAYRYRLTRPGGGGEET